MARYVAYGIPIETELNLAAYLCSDEKMHEALSVSLGSAGGQGERLTERLTLVTSHGRGLTLMTDRVLGRSVPDQPWCFEVDGVARFHWMGGAAQIRIEPLPASTDGLLAFWLIHIFLPLYFSLEDVYEIIHACAVEVAGETILFTAPSHGGKSTLTDYFLKQGHTLVSDDKVATFRKDSAFMTVPSHPNHRPYRRFEDLGRRVERFSKKPRQIDAVYVLQRTAPTSEVRIEETRGHRKFACLLPNYMFNFGIEPEKRMAYLAQLVANVPAFQVEVPWALNRLGEVYGAIVRRQLLRRS